MPNILDKINNPNDIKEIPKEEYGELAQEIRDFLLERISEHGGHLASNLGVVELTMALHIFMDFPKDQLIWDVGHQAYTHKILTGRKSGFDTLREFGGMSGFPKCKESDADAFNTGHSSTSISAALGIARARDLKAGDEKVVAVIGDGALSGGMAFEALNNAARMKTNMIIILNDNNMSISENVGGMSTYLGKLRTDARYDNLKTGVEHAILKVPQIGDAVMGSMRKVKESVKRLMVPGMLFEDMGITYLGPIDGHNIDSILTMLRRAQMVKGTALIHVVTKKGKGYRFAERFPTRFHGVNPFCIETGKGNSKKNSQSYTDIFSEELVSLAEKNDRITAITAAMPSGTGLSLFKEKFPKRFTDVGIAEEHAVTYAAGMAKMGMIPVVAIYSTFLQRAYDQILHDVCLGRLPVVFAIDRAGIVGNDGETHQGVFDISFLGNIPNLTIMAPKNAIELRKMLQFAVELGEPVAIRYPRGTAYLGLEDKMDPLKKGKAEVIFKGDTVAIMAVGSMVKHAENARELLKERGVDATVINVRFIKPFDEELVKQLAKNHKIIVTMEENMENGGFGQMISSCICHNELQVKHINISVKDQFVEHGKVYELYKMLGFDSQSVVEKIMNKLDEMR